MRHRRSDPLAEEMSALDELEDELQRPKRRQGSLIVPLLITAIVMTGAMTIAWYSYNAGVKEGSEGAAPLLKPSGPMKVAPASPGGLDIPHQEKTVYNAIDGRGRDNTAERLLPPPERPMPIPPARTAQPKAPVPPAGSRVRSADRAPEVRSAPGGPVQLQPRAPSSPTAPTVTVTPQPQTPPKTPPPKTAAPKTLAPPLASKKLKSPPEPPTLKKPPQPQPRAVAKATPRPTTSAAAAGAYRIQIGSVSSQTQARKYWTAQAAKHKDILGKLSMNLQQATIKGRVFYRIQGGPLPNRAAASKLCDQLKRRQIGCILVPPKR